MTKMTNLFVYGALMYDEVWNRIVSGEFRKTNAELSGYRRLAVKDEDYPGLVKSSGTVEGYIWFGIDDENLKKLDVFEGEYYERISAFAVDNTGNKIEVDIYYFRNKYHHLFEDHEWDVKKFETSGLKKFMSRYFGFKKL